ncbi:MAG: DUF1272 domain-containing protein [Oceanospirillaceae bacterium]|nr:DUF1272 domain-containing protein [Oceanospirillaceae bacterium]
MLSIRPNCEHCDVDLPADSVQAKVCSFECTFCTNCVENVLDNCCPNCGGDFQIRPIRPATNFKNGNYLGDYPAQTQRLHRPVDLKEHLKLLQIVREHLTNKA